MQLTKLVFKVTLYTAITLLFYYLALGHMGYMGHVQGGVTW